MAPCFLFLAAKVEEQPRKLEHVLKATHLCLHPNKDEPPLDVKGDVSCQISARNNFVFYILFYDILELFRRNPLGNL